VLSALREALPGIKAFFVLGTSGELLDGAASEPALDVTAVASEYATLLRIVERTSKDAGMGDMQEQILISSTSLTLVLHLPNDSFAVFMCSPGESIGRLRYELKRSLLYSSLSNL
jgi:predicted regulator of Ras-like GTPase activity (Roadblock/LC7/MglB family)